MLSKIELLFEKFQIFFFALVLLLVTVPSPQAHTSRLSQDLSDSTDKPLNIKDDDLKYRMAGIVSYIRSSKRNKILTLGFCDMVLILNEGWYEEYFIRPPEKTFVTSSNNPSQIRA